MSGPRVTVWNEYRHEQQDEHIGKIYPEGIHGDRGGAARAGLDGEDGDVD